MRSPAPHVSAFAARHQQGVSLIELMISLTIGMILLLGISALIVQQNSTRDELEKSSRQIENGRYAMQILSNEIEHAGYYGPYAPASNFTYTLPVPCGPTWNQGWSVTGTPPTVAAALGPSANDATVASWGCAGITNRVPGTGVLVVRRADTLTTPAAAPSPAGGTFLQISFCGTEAPNTPFIMGTGPFNLRQKDCLITVPTVNQYHVRIYYISSCNTVNAANVCTDAIPTLKMVQNDSTVATPLVEGIETMQFDYGVDASIPSGNADGYPDSYCADPDLPAACLPLPLPALAANNTSNWPNVMAVRVNLLARNNDCTTEYVDTKTYNLGMANTAYTPPAATACTNGGYKRHLYSSLVRVVNQSARRE